MIKSLIAILNAKRTSVPRSRVLKSGAKVKSNFHSEKCNSEESLMWFQAYAAYGMLPSLRLFANDFITQVTFIIPKHIFRSPGYFSLEISCWQIPFNIFKILLIERCSIFIEVIFVILEIQENLFWAEIKVDGLF